MSPSQGGCDVSKDLFRQIDMLWGEHVHYQPSRWSALPVAHIEDLPLRTAWLPATDAEERIKDRLVRDGATERTLLLIGSLMRAQHYAEAGVPGNEELVEAIMRIFGEQVREVLTGTS